MSSSQYVPYVPPITSDGKIKPEIMDHWFGGPSYDPGDRTYPTGLTSDVQKAAFDDIGSWDVSKVTNMSELFKFRRTFNKDIGDWDVSNVTTLYRTFYHAEEFNRDISKWNVSNVTTLHQAFYAAKKFNQSIDSWDVSKVKVIYQTFALAYKFNQSISSWNVSSVTDMVYAFWRASAFNQDLSLWERPGTPTVPASTVRNVTSFYNMFAEATAFNQDLSPWDISGATNLGGMFAQSAMSSKKLQWGPIAEGVVRDAPPYGDIFEATSGNEITTRRNAAFIYAGIPGAGGELVKNVDEDGKISEWKATASGGGDWSPIQNEPAFAMLDPSTGVLKLDEGKTWQGSSAAGNIITIPLHDIASGEGFILHIYTLPRPEASEGDVIQSGDIIRTQIGQELTIGTSTFVAHHTQIPAVSEAGIFTAVDSEHTYYKSSDGDWYYAYIWNRSAAGYRWTLSGTADGTPHQVVTEHKFGGTGDLTFTTDTNEWMIRTLPTDHTCSISGEELSYSLNIDNPTGAAAPAIAPLDGVRFLLGLTENGSYGIAVRNIQTGMTESEYTTNITRAVKGIASDGEHVVCGSGDHVLLLKWDGTSLQLLNGTGYFASQMYHKNVTSVAMTMDGSKIASGGGEYRNPELKIWDGETGQLLRTFDEGSHDYVLSVAISNKVAVSGNSDGDVNVHEITDDNPDAWTIAYHIGGASFTYNQYGHVNSVAVHDEKMAVGGTPSGYADSVEVREAVDMTEQVQIDLSANAENSAYLIGGEQNPTLTMKRGTRYTIKNTTSGHPFQIKEVRDDGTTTVIKTGKSGPSSFIFTPWAQTPSNLTYVCTAHDSMTGQIQIVDPQFDLDVKDDDSAYLLDGVSNPTLYMKMGITYTINNIADGHPFQIRDRSGTTILKTGESGPSSFTFTPGSDTPVHLTYVCTSHPAMTGRIRVLYRSYEFYDLEDISNQTPNGAGITYSVDMGASIVVSGGNSPYIRIWDIFTGRLLDEINTNSSAVRNVALWGSNRVIAAVKNTEPLLLEGNYSLRVYTLRDIDSSRTLTLSATGTSIGLKRALALAKADGSSPVRIFGFNASIDHAFMGETFEEDGIALLPDGGRTVLENTDYVLKPKDARDDIIVITGMILSGEYHTLPPFPAQPGSFLSSLELDGTATIANVTEAAGPEGCVIGLYYADSDGGDSNKVVTYPVPGSVPAGGSSTVQVGVRYIYLVKLLNTTGFTNLKINEMKVFADGKEVNLEEEVAAGSIAIYSSNLATDTEDLTNLFDGLTSGPPVDGSYPDYFASATPSGGIPPTHYHWSGVRAIWVMIDLKRNRNVTKVRAHAHYDPTKLDLYTSEGALAYSADLSDGWQDGTWNDINIPKANARLLVPDTLHYDFVSYRGMLWNITDFNGDTPPTPFEPVRVVLYNTSTSMALAYVQVFDGDGALANVSNVVTTGPHKVGSNSVVHLDAISAATQLSRTNEFSSTGVSVSSEQTIHFPVNTQFPDWLSSRKYFMMHIKHEDVKMGLLMRVGSSVTDGTTTTEGELTVYNTAMYVYSNERPGWYYRNRNLDRQVAIPGVGTSLPGYWTSGVSVSVARGGPNGDWYSFNPSNDQDPVYHFAGSSGDEYPFQNAREGTQINQAVGPATATVTSLFGPRFDAAALVGTTDAEVILFEVGSTPSVGDAFRDRGPDMGDLDAVYTTGGAGTFTLAPVLAEGGTAWDMRQPGGVAGLDATSPFWSMSARGEDGVLDTISKIRVWTDSDADRLPSRMAVYSSDGHILEDRALTLAAGTFNDITIGDYRQMVKDEALAQNTLKKFVFHESESPSPTITFGQERYGVDGYYTVQGHTVSAVSPHLPGVAIDESGLHPITVRKPRSNPDRTSDVTLMSGGASVTYSVGAEPASLNYRVSSDQPLTIRQHPGSLSITFTGFARRKDIALRIIDPDALTVEVPEGMILSQFVRKIHTINIGEFSVPYDERYSPSTRLRITTPSSSPHGSFRAEVGGSRIVGSDAFILSDGSLVGGQLSSERAVPSLESLQWRYGDAENMLTVLISKDGGDVLTADLPSRLVVLKEDGAPLTLSDAVALADEGDMSVFHVKVDTEASVSTLALTARFDGGPGVVKHATVLVDDQSLGDPAIPTQMATVIEEDGQTKLKITGLTDEGTSPENLIAKITSSEQGAQVDSDSVSVNADGEATILYTPPQDGPLWRVKGAGDWLYGTTPPSFASNSLTEEDFLSEDATLVTKSNRPINEALLLSDCTRVGLVRIALGESQTASLQKVNVRSIDSGTVTTFFDTDPTVLDGDPVPGLFGGTRVEQLVNVLDTMKNELTSGSTGSFDESSLTSWYAVVQPAVTQASLISHFVTNEAAGHEVQIDLGAQGHSAYVVDDVQNPTLYMQRGGVYTINNTTSGHPFQIRDGESVVATGSNGPSSFTFTPGADTPSTLTYVCTSHPAMTGQIKIVESVSEETKWTSASAAHSHTVGVGTLDIPAGHYRLVTDAASPTVSVNGEGRWPGLFEIPEVVAGDTQDDVHLRIEHRIAPCQDGAHSGAVNANACGFDVVVGGVPVATQLRYNRKDEDGTEYGVVRLRVDTLEGGGIATTALQDGLWYRATAPWRAGPVEETQ